MKHESITEKTLVWIKAQPCDKADAPMDITDAGLADILVGTPGLKDDLGQLHRGVSIEGSFLVSVKDTIFL